MNLKELFEQSMKLISSNQLQQAESFIFDILEKHPQWPVAHSLMGLVQVRKQQPQNAEVAFFKALSLDPQNPEHWRNYLKILEAPLALQFCLEHLHLLPNNEELLARIRQLIQQHGQPHQGIPLLFIEAQAQKHSDVISLLNNYLPKEPQIIFQGLKLLSAHPQYAELLSHVLKHYLQNQQAHLVIQLGKQTLEFNALNKEQHFCLAKAYILCEQAEQALPHFEHCWTLSEAQTQIEQLAQKFFNKNKWKLADAYLTLYEKFFKNLNISKEFYFTQRMLCAHHLCQYETQNHFEKKLTEISSKLKYELVFLTQFPYIYDSLEHLKSVRQNFETRLTKLEQKIDQAIQAKKTLNDILIRTPFYLAYQGYDDYDLMTRYGNLCSKIIKYQGLYTQCEHEPGQSSKLRIGFVSSFFREHSVSICYGHLISDIAQQADVEVYLFYLEEPVDHVTQRLRKQTQHFIQCHAVEAKNAILKAQLDVLIYTDIGMDGSSYALALNRLAPIQCLLGGHPVTSGLPELDYKFLSSSNAQIKERFREFFLITKGSRTKRIQEPPPPASSRRELGLKEDEHVYFCPMTLQKIHPEFDVILQGILEKDPKAQIYFAYSKNEGKHLPLQHRFKRQMKELADRIHFVPWMPKIQLLQFIQNSDLILDSIYFGSGTTTHYILGLDKAILTWPGPFTRSRLVYIRYQEMGFNTENHPLIAKTHEDYVEKAVEFVNNPDLQKEIQHQIQISKPAIFNNTRASGEVLNILRQAIKQYPEKCTIQL